ncbi:MAG: ubiquinol-cytochrome c reductase iron-sulfur subunit [Rhizobiales bacterium]|nr:ubiquinol-cytochrome c reductase iron-sulfur subunit [Hyphomicrobiales bacterium]
MAHDAGDANRRDFLMVASGAFLAVGGAAALWPLIDQMNPDAGAQALASIDVDVSSLAEGAAMTVMWRGKPVFIRHRTTAEIEAARTVSLDELPDGYARSAFADDDAPASDENRVKSGEEKWLVLIGICTHLGCIPKGQRLGDNRGEFKGWFCPCHGSHYDTSGRIRKGPAAENLPVPPYTFSGDARITIG